MNCHDFENKISGYIDGELPDDERKLFDEHLASCKQCSGLLHELQSVDQMLSEMEDPLPDEAYWAGFDARLRDKVDGVAEKRPWWNFYPLIRRHLGWALVAIVILMVAVVPILREAMFTKVMKTKPSSPVTQSLPSDKIDSGFARKAENEKKELKEEHTVSAPPAEASKDITSAEPEEATGKIEGRGSEPLTEGTKYGGVSSSPAKMKGTEKPTIVRPMAPSAEEPSLERPVATGMEKAMEAPPHIPADKPADGRTNALPDTGIKPRYRSVPRRTLETDGNLAAKPKPAPKALMAGKPGSIPPEKPGSLTATVPVKESKREVFFDGTAGEDKGAAPPPPPAAKTAPVIAPEAAPAEAVKPDADDMKTRDEEKPASGAPEMADTAPESEGDLATGGAPATSSIPVGDVSATAHKKAGSQPRMKAPDTTVSASMPADHRFGEKMKGRKSLTGLNNYLATSEVVLIKLVAMPINKANLEDFRKELTLANYMEELNKNADRFRRDPILEKHSRTMQIITNDIMTIKPKELPGLKRKVIDSGIIDRTRELKN